MPEIEAFKVLIGSLGGGGLAAGFAWLLFKAYTQSVKDAFQIQERRIEAVEARSKQCEDDRKNLHAEIHRLQSGVIEDTRTALTRTSEVLERFAGMVEQRGWSILVSNKPAE